MIKRLLSVLLSVTMAAMLLVGCGSVKENKTENDVKTEPVETVEKVEPVETVEKVQIRVPDLKLENDGMNAYYIQKQEEFDELYGDKIEVIHFEQPASGDVNNVQNLTALLLSKDAPAYVNTSSSVYLKDIYNIGLITDITDVVDKLGIYDRYAENAISALKYSDGSIIGLPNVIDLPLLGFNNKMLIEAGYDPETFTCETWDDYYEAVKAMTTSEHKGASIYAAEYFLWPSNWLRANGADIVIQNEDRTITANYTDEKVVETIEFLRKLYHEGLTNENIGYSDLMEMLGLIFQEKVASFTFYPSWQGMLEANGGVAEDLTLTMFPKGPSGDYNPVYYVTSVAFNSQISDAELEAAVFYYSFMSSPEFWQGYIEFAKENGVDILVIPPVKDIDVTEALMTYPEQWKNVIKEAIEVCSDTTHNATGYSTYISASLPSIITSEDNDVVAAMKDVEELTKNEWLDNYNKNVTKYSK